MSDLDPHLTSFEAELVDPAVTRLVPRDRSGSAASLLDRAAPPVTSMSFVVPEDACAGATFVEALRRWDPEHIRLEVLAVSGMGRRPSMVPGPQDDSDVPLRALRRPLGGRAAVLSQAADQAMSDFVVVASSDEVPFGGLTASLGHMWAEGCDAALVDPRSAEELAADGAPLGIDAAGELAAWLGPSGPHGRVVVMRRWVARWLFNEVNRAIDPWEEVADRARLLGIGILHQRDS